jgi:tricorn protease-like protein
VTTRLTDADGSVAMAADGSIAFLVRDSLAATHVAVGRYSAPEAAHTVTNDVNLRDRWPAFSPDGQTVLFARVPVADDDVSAGIWTVEIGSGRLSALTTTGAFPRWLP